MEKPVFVLIRKHYQLFNGQRVPFSVASSDFEVFSSFEDAKNSAMCWAMSMGKNRHVLRDFGELPRSAVQCDNLVFSLSITCCFSRLFEALYADIYQKYVL